MKSLQQQVATALARIPENPRTRFAPSPTGYLHLGHVVNMIFVWGIARARNGTVLCRMEDHDRSRWRPEYEKAILKDMEWLGFIPDEGLRAADAEHRSSYRQSDCGAFYLQNIRKLKEQHSVYACRCTRKQLQQHQPENSEELHYPGFCRTETHSSVHKETLRVHIPDDSVSFDDLFLGPQTQVPAQQCGDFSLRDRHGNWTYQFACVCDDLRQNIDLVIRGKDLLFSTGRQILLGQMLGRDSAPLFLHHPLLHDETGKKLSKRFLSESITQMRSDRVKPEEIIGNAAFQAGLTASFRPLSASDCRFLFQVS